jgi:hypothetical protein
MSGCRYLSGDRPRWSGRCVEEEPSGFDLFPGGQIAAGYSVSQRIRKRVEETFGWMKTIGGEHKLRYRGRQRNRAWFKVNAAVYNLIRIAALDAQPAWPTPARATRAHRSEPTEPQTPVRQRPSPTCCDVFSAPAPAGETTSELQGRDVVDDNGARSEFDRPEPVSLLGGCQVDVSGGGVVGVAAQGGPCSGKGVEQFMCSVVGEPVEGSLTGSGELGWEGLRGDGGAIVDADPKGLPVG